MKGDLAIRPYRRPTSDPRKIKEREAYRAPVREMFEDFANAYNFARNTWCDMVIDPLETRKWISMGIEIADHAPIEKQYNVGIIQT